MNTKFSVIVPIYNAEKYLPRCIESVLTQSCGDFELILVVDGSPDGSGEICGKYAATDGRIKVIEKENGGALSARKAGAAIATGDYIICVDGDDYIDTGLLTTLTECINQTGNPDMICFGHRNDRGGRLSDGIYHRLAEGIYTDMDEIRRKYMFDPSLGKANSGCVGYEVWSKAVKRELFSECQTKIPDNIRIGEDLVLTARLLAEAKSLCVLRYAGYVYCQNESSVMHNKSSADLMNVNIRVRELEKIGAYPFENIAVHYVRSVFDIINLMAVRSKSYKEFSAAAGDFHTDEKYRKFILPYAGFKLKLACGLALRGRLRLFWLLTKLFHRK